MAPPALRALLANSIDYAGLFPPADLALAPALTNHAAYVRSSDRWMLGTFVLPMGNLTKRVRCWAVQQATPAANFRARSQDEQAR
jgi:hypothetical protein